MSDLLQRIFGNYKTTIAGLIVILMAVLAVLRLIQGEASTEEAWAAIKAALELLGVSLFAAGGGLLLSKDAD
jgi:hypothetical protein